jgi:hypothetical protein
MDREGYDLPDQGYADPVSRHEPKPVEPLHWPWLVLIGLAAVGLGALGALLLG